MVPWLLPAMPPTCWEPFPIVIADEESALSIVPKLRPAMPPRESVAAGALMLPEAVAPPI